MDTTNTPKDDVLPMYKPNQATGSPYIQFTEEPSPTSSAVAPGGPAASAKATTNYLDGANADLVETVADANAAVNPQAPQGGFYLLNAIGSGIANVWSSWIGKVALLGVAAGIAALVYSHYANGGSSTSSAVTTLPPTVQLTSAQAAQDQVQLASALSATAKSLKAAGYNATLVDSERNFAQLSAGSALQLAVAPAGTATIISPSSHASLTKSEYVVGSRLPSDYVPISQVPVTAYLNTLSKNPSPSELQDNANVIHGDSGVSR